MQKSLTNMCLENIAESVCQMPPLIQDMVINTSCDKLKKEVKEEVKKEVKEEVKEEVSKDMSNILPHIIPEIMADIFQSMTNNNTTRTNFYEVYNHIDKNLITCAIKSAENSIFLLENKYIYNNTINRQPNDLFYEDDDDDYSEEYYSY